MTEAGFMINGRTLESLTYEQLTELSELVRAEIARREAGPSAAPGPSTGAIYSDNATP